MPQQVFWSPRTPYHSSLGKGLSGIGQALLAAYGGHQSAKVRQREEAERARLLEEKRFATQQSLDERRRALAATLPEDQLAALFPPTMQAPDPTTGQLVDVNAPGANLVPQPGTEEFKGIDEDFQPITTINDGGFIATAPSQTPDIGIPEHLGGGVLPGAPLLSREDIEEQELATARRAALANRGLGLELGDQVTITQEHIDALPPGLQGMYSVGQVVPRNEIGSVQMGAWKQLEGERQARAREDRSAARQTRSIGGRVKQFNPETGQYDIDVGSAAAPISQEVTPEMEERVLRGTVSDWRDWNEGMLIAEDASSRKDRRLIYKDIATQHGRVLPSKVNVKAVRAGQKTLADINDAKELLFSDEVREAVGRYQGSFTDFTSDGWLDFVDVKPTPEVRRFRAIIKKLSAEERHRLYGAALTAVESKFARGFLPDITQPIDQLVVNLEELGDDITRGLDAVWGIEEERPPAEAAPVGAGGAEAETRVGPDGRTYRRVPGGWQAVGG